MVITHRKRQKREIFESREDALKAENKGKLFYVRMPTGELRYSWAGSNSAAVYDVFRSFGGSVRTCRGTPGDVGEALDTISALPKAERQRILDQLKKMA